VILAMNLPGADGEGIFMEYCAVTSKHRFPASVLMPLAVKWQTGFELPAH